MDDLLSKLPEGARRHYLQQSDEVKALLAECFEREGCLPPPGKWEITFGLDADLPPDRNGWMLR